MAVLKQVTKAVELHIGSFESDDVFSDFNVERVELLPYAHFMANFYHYTNMIQTKTGVIFTISPMAYIKAVDSIELPY